MKQKALCSYKSKHTGSLWLFFHKAHTPAAGYRTWTISSVCITRPVCAMSINGNVSNEWHVLHFSLFQLCSCCALFSLRCKELPEGSSGQHHHSSCWGTNSLHTSSTPWTLLVFFVLLSNPAFTRFFFFVSSILFFHRQLSLSQVFTVSKDLVPRVLSKIVESVADEMCRLMQCVSSFSKNGALQVHTDTHTQKHTVIKQFITLSKTLTHKSTPTLVGDLPVISDNAIFQFKLPTADSWQCSFDFISSFFFL